MSVKTELANTTMGRFDGILAGNVVRAKILARMGASAAHPCSTSTLLPETQFSLKQHSAP